MTAYYVTFQVTQEITEQVFADSSEQAQATARSYVEDLIRPLASYDIQLVKIERGE